MFAEYIQAALDKAEYKLIEDTLPVFGEVPELEGVWAAGATVEECRKELISVIEGWIALRLAMGDSIPVIGDAAIIVSTEPMAMVRARSCLQSRAHPEAE
ncbi:MAG TPA: type II toxin-antitoxin system HicB family antitoxin [Methanothrix sp.]|jgi:predicted RNase H-like HicB family nuclease|nr:type II toxin-antitoxin system HicB family antitoxin [Methanothrix sp.]